MKRKNAQLILATVLFQVFSACESVPVYTNEDDLVLSAEAIQRHFQEIDALYQAGGFIPPKQFLFRDFHPEQVDFSKHGLVRMSDA